MRPVWLHSKDGAIYQDVHSGLEAGIGHDLSPGTAIAVVDSGEVLGAGLFNNYQPESGVIELHAAAVSPRWLTRAILREMFSYPFIELGCQAVVMRAHPKNKRVERVATAYGFKRYEIPRLRGRDTSEAIYILGDDDWAANGFHERGE